MGQDHGNGDVAAGAAPVGRAELTNVSVPFFGMDGKYHRGTVTVNVDVTRDVIRAFNSIAAQRFPIRQALPIENYGGWDRESGRADNTTAFNCRKPSEANAPAEASPPRERSRNRHQP